MEYIYRVKITRLLASIFEFYSHNLFSTVFFNTIADLWIYLSVSVAVILSVVLMMIYSLKFKRGESQTEVNFKTLKPSSLQT